MSDDKYKVELRVSNPEALPEPIFDALRDLALTIADDQGDDVEGFRSQSNLSLGATRDSGLMKNDPSGWCLGYSGEFAGNEGSGSCWINW